MTSLPKLFDLAGKRVWVAGHRGMVGSALVRRLAASGCQVLTVDRATLDLRRQAEVEAWVAENRPDAVFIAAATVGGIQANSTRPGEFCYDNIAITTNIVHAAHLAGVGKLLFLGSSCIYPRLAEQPMREDSLWTGPLEPTNEGYAVAKLAGITLCKTYRRQYGRDFVSVIPTNLYGPGDNLDPASNHVVPATLTKVARARDNGGPVEVWGTGTPRREFLYVEDAADALVFLMEHWSGDDVINIGAGEDVSIADLARLAAQVVGYTGDFHFDTSKPDGMPRKQLEASRLLEMGWRPKTSLLDGLAATWAWIGEVGGSRR
jgi:GDP-L-fucose synthase